MSVKLLPEYHLEFLSLKGGCRGSSESTLVKLLEISCRSSFVNQLTEKCTTRVEHILIGPRREKTCLREFRQSEFQTSLLSYRD